MSLSLSSLTPPLDFFLHDQMTSLMNNSLLCTNSNLRIHCDNLVLTNDDVAHLKAARGETKEQPEKTRNRTTALQSENVHHLVYLGRCYFD